MLGCHLVLSLCLSCLSNHIVKIHGYERKTKQFPLAETTTVLFPSGYCVIVENDVSLRCSQQRRRSGDVMLGEDCCVSSMARKGISKLYPYHVWA